MMDFDDISGLPDWEDDRFDDEDGEGEEWKPNPTRDACKEMYEQWKQVMIVLKAAFESIHNAEDESTLPESHLDDYKQMLIGDAYEVAVKIQSSETGLFMIRMENASIIRKNAQFIKSSMLTLMIENSIEEEHGNVIRDEIDKFRILFRHWVSTFEKDEFEDEWGLF